MGRERRRFERIESLVVVKYVSRAGEISGHSLARDWGAGGLGMPSEGSIPKGTALDLVISISDGNEKKIPAAAKVVWSRRNGEFWKNRYSVGLEFLDIEPQDKNRILDYAKRNRWIKTDFERKLESNGIPVLNLEGELI